LIALFCQKIDFALTTSATRIKNRLPFDFSLRGSRTWASTGGWHGWDEIF